MIFTIVVVWKKQVVETKPVIRLWFPTVINSCPLMINLICVFRVRSGSLRLTEDMNHAHMSSTLCARALVCELSKEQRGGVLPGFCGSVTSLVAGRFGLCL